MIKKAKRILFVFLNSLLKELRMSYMYKKSFVGRYVEVEIERRRWAHATGYIIIGQKKIPTGVRKVHHEIVSYVPDNAISYWLGFRKNKVHFDLAWYQEPGKRKRVNGLDQIGGINLEGQTVK